MMTSMAEQRRFLMNLKTVSTARLNLIVEDLMSIIKNGQAIPSDIKFHEQICLELFERMSRNQK